MPTLPRSQLARLCSSVHPTTRTPGQGDVHAMIAIVDDVADAVRDAGGWMCDRVWAGWDVTAWVPSGCDTTPLRILGVTAVPLEGELTDLWPSRRPAAIAIGSDVTSLPSRIRTRVDALMRDPGTEVTVWGACRSVPGDRLHDVHHRLSAAAIAFKAHAMHAASLSEACGPTESFRSRAPWFPLPAGANRQRATGS